MTTILNHAIEYRKQGISVIPMTSYINPKDNKVGKKPLIKWEQYQKTLPTMQEILGWWTQWPTAMIGIVTGELSGMMVVDADTQEACELIEKTLPETWDSIAIVKSPRGGKHYYFKSLNGKWQTKAGVLPGIDIRANGGLICAAPSRNVAGKEYRWLSEIEFKKEMLEEMPDALSELLSSAQQRPKFAVDMKDIGSIFTPGRRDQDLFHLALAMRKAGESKEYAFSVLKKITEHWTDTNDDKLLLEKVRSAFTYEEKKERNLAEEVKEWLNEHDGEILTNDIYRDLNITDKTHKANIRKILQRQKEEKILRPDAKKAGCYHKIDRSSDIIDWKNADLTEVAISYPLELEKLCITLKKTIVVVAGVSDAGKTAFLLHCAALNTGRGMPIKYFSSEMGDAELRFRINQTDIPAEVWDEIDFRERVDNFADAIDPDAINIIDYIEIFENAYMIGKHIKDIFDKLKNGIALIAIQKDKNKELGTGSHYSMHKSRLYINIDYEQMTIKKLKNKRYMETKTRDSKRSFKIERGLLVPTSEWQL